MSAPSIAGAVFERIAAAWLRRAEDLAVIAGTGFTFEEWANWEAIFACHSEPSWRVAPRPAYRNLGVADSALLGDLLVESASGRVLVEVGTVHDWTLPKWRLKLLADTEKLRCLDASDVEPLQVILVARSGRFPSDRAPWLAQVPSWTACNLTPRRAPMPAGGAVEVRGWFPARTSATSRVAQR